MSNNADKTTNTDSISRLGTSTNPIRTIELKDAQEDPVIKYRSIGGLDESKDSKNSKDSTGSQKKKVSVRQFI